MPGQCEMLTDWTKAAEECLRESWIVKAAYLALAPAGQLMAIFGTVVHARSRLDEHMLYVGFFAIRKASQTNVDIVRATHATNE
jgi:hypothetical protein